MPSTAVVFAGGDPPGAAVAARVPSGAFVVAADAGLEHAQELGIAVDLVIGDLDSVSAAALDAARAAEVPISEHPTDKDATDLALAVETAAGHGASSLIVVGGGGGRLDHLLANVLVISAPHLPFAAVDLFTGTTRVHVVRGRQERALAATVGELCSLLPVHGPARDVHTEGLRWALTGEELGAGSSRGVSNTALAAEIVVRVGEGTLAVVFPGDGS